MRRMNTQAPFMPNALAYLMLILWPVVCLVLFRRLPMERAIIWSVLAGYLLLPPVAEFDLPLVPDMNKVSIPNISAFVLVLFYLKRPMSFWPGTWAMRILLVGFVLGVVPTVLSNGDPMQFTILGTTEPISFVTASIPGLGWIDLFSVVSGQIIVLMPFFLARNFLSSQEGLRDLLLALMLGGLVYTVPSLIEIRLSPQINVWVYGFFQHDFQQMMRDGGFRPIVFLPHALWLAFFMMTAVVSAVALGRAAEGPEKARYFAAALYLFFVLVLSKSLASLTYALLLVPVILLAGERLLLRVAIVMAGIAVLYPILRDNGWVPLEWIMAKAEAINPERAQSLGYRFDNEEILLERAHEKWLFGWGGWGRNLVRDMQTGEIISIPDGEWIIVFGTFGWVGYLSQMGLLAVPLFMLWRARRGAREAGGIYAGAMALILAITLVDMLLNAILTPYTWLVAGAVWGHAEALRARQAAPDGGARDKAGRTVLADAPDRQGRTVL